jgi:uncharacterized membrane protein YhaH (DUF805 family)
MVRRLFTDFQFNGRIAREAYWKMFALRAAVCVLAVLMAADSGGEMAMAEEADPIGLIAGLIVIVVGISGIAESSRRLHDTGKPGWWNLLLLIPYLGWAGLIYLLAQPGQPAGNEYGPPSGGWEAP